MSPTPASAPFDTRPLTEPVQPAVVRAYVRQLRESGRAPVRNMTPVVIGAVIGIIFLSMFGTVFGGMFTTFAGLAGSAGAPAPFRVIFTIVPIFILGVFLTIAITIGVRLFRGPDAARWYRLDRFASANGMAWYPEARNPPLPGLVFDQGHSRVATDIVRGDRPRLVEFANYRYKTGSGKNESTHRWGYVAVKLSSPLPHIVLDAVGNNGLFGSNLPASFDRHQRLSLEGDFDRYFALFCPAGYEADALYLFTPDIMARFIDHAAALDVEIVDDWLFLYTQRDVPLGSAPSLGAAGLRPAEHVPLVVAFRGGFRPKVGHTLPNVGHAPPGRGRGGAGAGGSLRLGGELASPQRCCAVHAARRRACSTGSGTGRDASSRFV